MQAVGRYATAVRSNDFADAEIAIDEVLSLAAQRAMESDADSLAMEVTQCEQQRDYSRLEAVWVNRIEDARECGDKVTCGYHLKLSYLYVALNRFKDALAQSQMARAATDTLGAEFVTTMVLKNQGIIYLRLDRLVEAHGCFSEGLKLLDPTDKLFDQSRASLMILRAQCAVAVGEYDRAVDDLDRAVDLLRPRENMPLAAGIQMDIAAWYEVTGTLRLKTGDIEGALSAWAEAVERKRLVNSMPHCAGLHAALDLAHALHHFGEVLQCAGNYFDAQRALDESAAIVADLGLPPQEYSRL